jgi:hypothetical protein
VLCRGLEKNGVVGAWHGRGMASVNQTRPLCVNQMGKTHFKPLATKHGRGTAWARHAMCESAFIIYKYFDVNCLPTKSDGSGNHRKVTPVRNVPLDLKEYWQVNALK